MCYRLFNQMVLSCTLSRIFRKCCFLLLPSFVILRPFHSPSPPLPGNIFPITLPPLRERKEDIPLLIRYFIKKYREINPRVHNISKRAIQILLSHNFPGNIRELRNIIMRAMALVDNSNTIEPEHLIFGNSPNLGILDDKNVITVERRATLKKTVEELERQLIEEACKSCNGNKSQVAETLGLSRVGLNKKLTRYNIFC